VKGKYLFIPLPGFAIFAVEEARLRYGGKTTKRVIFLLGISS